MKKALTLIGMAILTISMTLVLTGCPGKDKEPENDGVQSENGANHQFEGGVTIPPDAVRESDEEWSQTFEIDENDSEHSFSIGEIIDEPEENE